MILHLLTDEQFTDYAIAQFSAPEFESDFVLLPSNHENWTVKLMNKCTIVQRNSPEFDALLNRLDQYSGIVMHGMFWAGWQRPILERVSKSVKVAWYFWGGDIYCREDLSGHFYAPITKFMVKLHDRKKEVNQRSNTWELPLDLYKRVDYCLTSEYEEYEFVKQYTGASFKHLWYTCYSLEDTIGGLMSERCKGSNIWIGNSAAVANNHLDVLWLIMKKQARLKLESRDVIMPLSYGSPWVRNMVLKVGKFLFGRHMRPLEKYIPRDEYNRLMLSCSTMIIGYWEPAAQGNIITALWLGMRVYLSEKSMTYAFFKRIGAKVFSIEKDLPVYGYTALQEDDRATNRVVLKKWYSKEHVEQAVKDVVNELR